MAIVNHSATLDGTTDFTDLEGNTISWGSWGGINFVGMFEPNNADTTTSDLTLSGSNWFIDTLRYGSSTEFTNVSEANSNTGREIHYLRLGQNSTVNLDTTRVDFLDTSSSGNGTHDVTLGSEGARVVRLRGDDNILTTGSGWVNLIDTQGDDTVTINSGGAGDVNVGDGSNVVTVQGGFVKMLEAIGGLNDVTVNGNDGQIRTLSLHNTTNTVDLQGGNGIQFFQTSFSSNAVSVDQSWLTVLDSYNASNTITIGSNGGAGWLQFGGDSGLRTQTINADGWLASVRVWGTQVINLTYGAAGGQTAVLGDMADTVTTGTGFVEFISTGRGNDVVTIGAGGSSGVRLGGGSDRITTGTGFVDYINGGNGNDFINIGTGGAINARGGNGNDVVRVSEMSGGGLTVYGGNGIDTLNFRNFTTGVTFSLDTSDFQDPGPTETGGFLQHGFENLTGTFQADALTGSEENNRLDGLAGDDTMTGLQGDDVLLGRLGDDRLLGNLGNDILRGHRGNDTLLGGNGDDRLLGGNDNDLLIGHIGADTLLGNGGDDVLRGRIGNDRLEGGNGDDTLLGGNGNDTLLGGNGNDTMTGGPGPDVFVFAPNAGTDRVQDFADGSDLLRIGGHAGGFGTLGFNDVGSDLHVTHDGGTIILTGQAGTVLTNADFDFV